MSRRAISNAGYSFAFGVDHTPMGCFFQIWEKAAKGEQPEEDEMEAPQVEADELYGVTVLNERTLERNGALKKQVDKLREDPSKTARLLRNQDTILAIAEALGFDPKYQVRDKSLTTIVYELWD